MSGFGAGVIAEAELAELQCLGKLTELEVNRRDLLKRLSVKVSQAALLRKVPFAAAVILEQRPPVKPDSLVIGVHDFLGPARSPGQLRVVKGRQELVAVDPPVQLGIEDVAAVAVQDGLRGLSGSKGVAQAVERDVEVVAGGVMAVVGPLQGHQ